MTTYLLDSNFFIQAHRSSYPLDVVKGFWLQVKLLADEGVIKSIDKVRNEIFGHNDELEKWCKDNLPQNFFQDSSNFISSYGEVVRWANSKSTHFSRPAIEEFLNADFADAFLVACSLESKDQFVIVTQEISQPNRRNKIKIPEACNAFSLRYINTIDLFRELGVTF